MRFYSLLAGERALANATVVVESLGCMVAICSSPEADVSRAKIIVIYAWVEALPRANRVQFIRHLSPNPKRWTHMTSRDLRKPVGECNSATLSVAEMDDARSEK